MDPYEHIAPVYDAVTSAFLRRPRREAVAACRELGARRVLDAGCGTGVLLGMLRGHAESVIGLDSSAAMLEKGKERAGRRRGGDLGASFLLVRGDADQPPFRPQSFDILIYALVLHETASSAEHLLHLGFSLAPRILALEWRLPERNLDHCLRFWVPCVERLAGREHYRHYRAFMRGGGIQGLAWRTGAEIVWEKPLRCNSLVLSLLQRRR